MSRRPDLLLLPLVLAGCATAEPGLLCGDFTQEVDGLCVGEEPVDPPDPDPPTIEAALDTLPPCEAPDTGDGRLDLQRSCADDVCADAAYDDIVATMGEPTCAPLYEAFPSLIGCTWSNQATASFYDYDTDGEPDVGWIAFQVSIETDYTGRTLDGLGLGDRPSCFIDALGTPTALNLVKSKSGWGVAYAAWESTALYDRGDGPLEPPNGTVDQLTLARRDQGG